jgi:hypothetical protein
VGGWEVVLRRDWPSHVILRVPLFGVDSESVFLTQRA